MTNDHSQLVWVLRVRGLIDAVWAARFPEFTLTQGADGNTTFTGRVVDQAALHAILSRVRDFGLVLMSVETLDRPNGD